MSSGAHELWQGHTPPPTPASSNQDPSSGTKKKKKHRWGMTEVIASAILLIVGQLVISLGFVFWAVAEAIGNAGPGGLNEETIYEDLVAQITSSGPLIFGTSVLMYLTWVGCMWYSTRFRGLKSFRKDFWVSFKKHDWWKGLALAAGLMAVEYSILFLLQVLNVDTSGSNNAQIFLDMEGVWFWILCLLMIPILGPIAEELFFRGFLMQGLIRWFRHGNNQGPKTAFGGWWLNNFAFVYNAYHSFRRFVYHQKYTLAIIVSSVLFGLMHFQGVNTVGSWLVVLLTGMIGAAFAIVTVKTRRLGIAIWGHVFFNGATMAMLLISMALEGNL